MEILALEVFHKFSTKVDSFCWNESIFFLKTQT